MKNNLADIDRENLRASEWLYIEGYLMANERNVNLIIDTARFARENGVKIAISLSDPSIVQKFGDELRELINKDADLIFSNARRHVILQIQNHWRKPQRNLCNIRGLLILTDRMVLSLMKARSFPILLDIILSQSIQLEQVICLLDVL